MISAWHQQDKRASNTPRERYTGEKRCACCKETLPATDFWVANNRPDGIDVYCIPCRKMKRKPKKRLSDEEIRRRFIKRCHERLAFWTNELNKAQKEGM